MTKNKLFILSLILLFQACGKIVNSSSLDRVYYSTAPTGSTLFTSVNSIIATKCSQCHGAWLSFSESDFVASGLVTPQSISNSKLYYRNQNATSGAGPQNMPSGGLPALTTTELQTLTDWINSL